MFYDEADMTKYRCKVCGYVYDPQKGDPSQDIPAGVGFYELPGSWKCPRCKVGKENFIAEQ